MPATPGDKKEEKALKEKAAKKAAAAAAEPFPQRLTLWVLNCLLGAKIPDRVKKMWASARVGCVGSMKLYQLDTAIKSEFPTAPKFALEKLPTLFEAAATGKPPNQGLSLEDFNKLFCVFLFHMFDKNGNNVLELPEAQKALEYLSGDARVPIARALKIVRTAAASNKEGDDNSVDISEFRQLYVTMLGGAALI